MTDPNLIVPKLLDLKHQDLTRRLSGVMSQIKTVDIKQAEIAAERARLDEQDPAYAQLSLQHGYGRYLQARSDALLAQKTALQDKARALQLALKETMCSQSIIDEMSQT